MCISCLFSIVEVEMDEDIIAALERIIKKEVRPRAESAPPRSSARIPVRERAPYFPTWRSLTSESKNDCFEKLFQCVDGLHDMGDTRATFGLSTDLMARTLYKCVPLKFNLGQNPITCTVEQFIDKYLRDIPGSSIEKKLRNFAQTPSSEGSKGTLSTWKRTL